MSDNTSALGEITINNVCPESAVLIQELVRRALRVNDFSGCEVSYTPPKAPVPETGVVVCDDPDETFMDLTNAVADMLRNPNVLGLFEQRKSNSTPYMYHRHETKADLLGRLLHNRLLNLREFFAISHGPGKMELMTRRLLALDMTAQVKVAITKPEYTVDLGQRPEHTRACMPHNEYIAVPDFVNSDGTVAYWTSIEIDIPGGTLVF